MKRKDYSFDYIEKAYEWYLNHKEHVDEMVSFGETKLPPSNEDRNHPELWKAATWRWFFYNYNME